jgi:hypothetical protein
MHCGTKMMILLKSTSTESKQKPESSPNAYNFELEQPNLTCCFSADTRNRPEPEFLEVGKVRQGRHKLSCALHADLGRTAGQK